MFSQGSGRLTFALIAVNFVVYLFQMLSFDVTLALALTPRAAFSGMYWQFVSYMFTHGSMSHIVVNMLVLFIFGTVVERVLGPKQYIGLYFICGIGSGLFHILLSGISDIPLLGASGAVFGVLTAYAVLFPRNLVFVFGLVPVPAALLVVLYAAWEFFSGVYELVPGIASFGHLGGILIGALLTFAWKARRKSRSPDAAFEFVWEDWQ